MKARYILATFLIAAAAFAKDPVTFIHTYKVGDVDAYHMTIKLNGGFAMTMTMDSTQTVKKVYDNGDADLETVVSNMEFNGNKMGKDNSSAARVSKYGMPVGKSDNKANNPAFFTKYATYFGNGGLEVGKTVTINDTDPDEPKNTVKGTVTLVGTEDGLSKIQSSMDVTTKDTGDTAMHVDSTAWVGAGAKLDHLTSHVTNLPKMGQGGAIDSVDVTMERKK